MLIFSVKSQLFLQIIVFPSPGPNLV